MTENSMPVEIKIRTTIRDGRQKERHSMDAYGHLSWRGGLVVLRFQEPREESEQKTMQTMRLREGRLSVKREGAITMNQKFVEGVKTEGTYRSPYGPMHMMTDTESINYTWDENKNKGMISLVYVLTLQGSETGTYSMEIVFEEGEQA